MDSATIKTQIAKYERLLQDTKIKRRETDSLRQLITAYAAQHDKVTKTMRDDQDRRRAALRRTDLGSIHLKTASTLQSALDAVLAEGDTHLARRETQRQTIRNVMSKNDNQSADLQANEREYTRKLDDLHRQLVTAQAEEASNAL